MPKFDKVEAYQAQIAKVPIFSYLLESDLKRLIKHMDLIIYEDGEKIVAQGDLSEYFFGVVKGQVDVSTRRKNKNIFIYTLGEGEIFGEAAIFMAGKRTANVSSSGRATVVRIHRKEIVSLIKNHPQSGNRFLLLIIYSLIKKMEASTQEIAVSKNIFMDRKDIRKNIRRFLK